MEFNSVSDPAQLSRVDSTVRAKIYMLWIFMKNFW